MAVKQEWEKQLAAKKKADADAVIWKAFSAECGVLIARARKHWERALFLNDDRRNLEFCRLQEFAMLMDRDAGKPALEGKWAAAYLRQTGERDTHDPIPPFPPDRIERMGGHAEDCYSD